MLQSWPGGPCALGGANPPRPHLSRKTGRSSTVLHEVAGLHGTWQDHELFEAWHPWSKESSTISSTCNQGEHHGRAQVTNEEARRSSIGDGFPGWITCFTFVSRSFRASHAQCIARFALVSRAFRGFHTSGLACFTSSFVTCALPWCSPWLQAEEIVELEGSLLKGCHTSLK